MSDLLTVSEVAALLKVSEETVTRRFAKVKGVIDLGSPETPKRRRYRVLRIPKSVVEKFVLARGGPVDITPPARPSKRKPPTHGDVPLDEDDIVRQLALVRKQHGAAAQQMLDRIAERARLLTFVPQSQWSDVVWFDDEDV